MSAFPTPAFLPRPVPGAPPRPHLPLPFRRTLEGGLRLVALPRTTFPQVAIRVVIPAAAAADPAGSEGLASLTGAMLTEGTERYSAGELNGRLDRLGAALSVQVGHDFAEIDLLMLRETLSEGLELLGEVLTRPTFPEVELERVRHETGDALEARLDEPANVADDQLAEAIYPEGHPYARLPLGQVDSVASIGRAQLEAFHRRHYAPEGAVLVAAGDIEPERFAALVQERLGGWRGRAGSPEYPSSEGADADAAGGALVIAWEDAQQAELRVGGRGMARSSPDWIPAAVANYLLGGSTITGRLGANLREARGWTYGVRSGFSGTVRRGGWGIETAVDAEVAEAALREIRRELTRFLAEPVSEEELRRGKDSLVLSLPRAFETPGRLVSRLATAEVFGLEPDYWQRFPDRVEAVDRDEVLRIAHTYFDPARLVTVTVGG